MTQAEYRGQNALHQIARALKAQAEADHWRQRQANIEIEPSGSVMQDEDDWVECMGKIRFWDWIARQAQDEAVRYARGACRALAGDKAPYWLPDARWTLEASKGTRAQLDRLEWR